MKKSWLFAFTCLLLASGVVVIYLPITKSFYQQDEWLGYGIYLSNGAKIIMQNAAGFWGLMLGQGRILTNLLYFLFYKFFPLNVLPVSIFAIIFHLANTIFVFLLAQKIFKKFIPAFLGSIFFAINSVSQSSITWPAASINTLPSTTLILVALYFYFKYLEIEKAKWLFLSFISIYVSLFFKETGIFLFLLIPLSSLFFKKHTLKSYIKNYWYYFLAAGVIVAYRVIQLLLIPHQEALFLTGSSKYFFDSIVVRSILYPLTSFSLTIIPSAPFVWFARYIENVNYPYYPTNAFILIAQSLITDLLSVIISFSLLIWIYFMARLRPNGEKKTIVFFILMLLFSFLPYVIISKNYAYLESRYYYFPSAIWGLIFAWIFTVIFEKSKLIFKVVSVLLFSYFIYAHTSIVSMDLKNLIEISQTRKSILNQLLELKPTLNSNKNIFYITGDKDYLLPGNKVPFQQGLGYTLMTLYYKNGKIPKQFLDGEYLFELGSQGYKETGAEGFGYFSDVNNIKEFVRKKDIVVTAFFYDSHTGLVKNITNEIK